MSKSDVEAPLFMPALANDLNICTECSALLSGAGSLSVSLLLSPRVVASSKLTLSPSASEEFD
ncbi:MAG: hypothetical protein KDB07_08720 [Planctomycetes bacterium]|nr:hypothetical protein [Planctomycetota bacterium]